MIFDLDQDDYELLMFGIAILTAGARQTNPALYRDWVHLANQINATNPDWTPYELPPVPLGRTS